jgi:hypothetical protein
MIANIDGYIRYVIRKPFHDQRERKMRDWVDSFDQATDNGWPTEKRAADRMLAAFSARAMDGKRWR